MKFIKNNFRFVLILFVALIISATTFAQYGHHHYYRNYYGYGYGMRPYVSVGIGYPGYAYPAVANPYYHVYPYVPYGLPFGFRVGILPFGFSTFFIGSIPYYYNDGMYYRPYANGGYEVVAPPLAATVSHLPRGTKVTVIDGIKYYEMGGTFYQEVISENNVLQYKVVGIGGVLNTDIDNLSAPSNNNNSYNNNNNIIPPAVIGSRVDQLPTNSKMIILDQQKFYVSPSGVYYKEVVEGNSIRYEVTGTASEVH